MKTIFPVLVLAGLCWITAAGQAADTKAAPDLVSVSGPFRGVEPLSFNVDFSGGPINKFIAAVAKAEGVSFTIIFNLANPDESAEFAKLELPPFSLRNVTLVSVVDILGTLLEPRGFKLRPVGGPNSFVCLVQKIPRGEKSNGLQIQFLSYQL